MLKNISSCSKCNLCFHQEPLVDNKRTAQIMWVGLSAKKVNDLELDIPLSNSTNTGKIISDIESSFSKIGFYKTNLVKCLYPSCEVHVSE
jgi:uracil-DNA glycosylase